MKQNNYYIFAIIIITLAVFPVYLSAQMDSIYKKPDGVYTRWTSFENQKGEKEKGGMENQGAKGAAFKPVKPGESVTLLDVKGSGMIKRMWFTVDDKTTESLRQYRLDIFWDEAKTPAVSVPFGDFFNAFIEKPVPYENILFSNPEGRSFNCYIPMPFKSAAKVVLTNESEKLLQLLFYDIDYLLGVKHENDMLYFHSIWRREMPTKLGSDFEILPKVTGSGRFLGTNIGINCRKNDVGWWGEGEIKMYIDGDSKYPTIVGTGTEDYIGTGWGQGQYANLYQGCLVSNKEDKRYTFYRYHVPDPIYFDNDIRVTIQQMGGEAKKLVIKMQKEGIPMIPVTIAYAPSTFIKLLENPPCELEKHDSPENSWTNYYRSDDVCATAFFYLNKTENGLPPLAPAADRIAHWKEAK